MSATLTLMQWLSPAFPVGAFAYSHGLEQAIAEGTIQDADTLQDWLGTLITAGSARADAVLLACTYAAQDPVTIDLEARAFAASAERLKETDLQGAAFCETANAVWELKLPALTYPVAVGAAASQMNIRLDEALPLYLHAFASNLVSAAQRALPLGQTDGQKVLAALAPQIADTAHSCQSVTLDDLTSSSFAADIAAMRHETLQPRIFRS